LTQKIYLSAGAKGILVKKLQAALKSKGAAVSVDGEYGPKTESAQQDFQKSQGVAEPVAGVSAKTWQDLTGEAPPSLFDRCLMLTSNIEGHGYQLAAGNWDKAGVTWGIVGFTIKSGSLYEVLRRIPKADLISVFGEVRTHQLVSACSNKSVEFGDSISLKPKKTRLVEAWQTAFDQLGQMESAIQAQNEVAKTLYWDSAMKQLEKFPQLKSERAAALFFDCFVQQGQVYRSSALAAEAVFANKGTEQKALEAIAQWQRDGMNLSAKNSFGENVYSRKILMAKGYGAANGSEYNLAAYGINMDPR